MNSESYHIYSAQGTQLFCHLWRPQSPPQAVLFIVHGLGEHHGRYAELARSFCNSKIAVFAFDHRGHGKSAGKRGHADGIDQLIEDTEHAMMKCRSIFLDLPIFIFGHSMGGQVVATFVNKLKSKELSGAIISSPWIKMKNPPPKWQVNLAKRLACLFPKLTMSNGLDPDHISSVKEEVEAYTGDPVIHDRISLSLFKSLYFNGLTLPDSAQAAKIPVLVAHGSADEITDPGASRSYAARLVEKANFKIWQNARHEPHHDAEKNAVIQHYIHWIESQAGIEP